MKKIIKILAVILIFIGLAIIGLIYAPVLKQEVRYQFNQNFQKNNQPAEIKPIDTDFGLMIPQINLNVKVFPNISDQDPGQYLSVLKKGVAHARGSVLPGQDGFVFIFAHSANTPLTISQFNAVFYLLNKLNSGEEIWVFYQGNKFVYQVEKKIITSPEWVVEYLRTLTGKKLILQTCYPPGTTIKRLLVISKEKL